MKKITLLLTVSALALGMLAAIAGAQDYVGANKCKMCHMKEYKAWSETKHAKSMESLKDAKATADFAAKAKLELKGAADKADGCVGCHVTGHKAATGFPQADSLKNANLAMVGCEGCHGPGSKHVLAPKDQKKATIVGAVDEAACKKCHTAATSPAFKFEEAKAKGVHAVAAAAK